MTLKILFLKITIQKHIPTMEELMHQEEIQRNYDRIREQQTYLHRL